MRFASRPWPQRVVDLVRARMQQVFSLQINLRSAQLLRQTFRKVKRRGPSGIILEQIRQLRLKCRIGLGFFVCALQLIERRHQRLRHIPPAVDAKAPRSCLARICRNNNRRHEKLPLNRPRKRELFSVLGARIKRPEPRRNPLIRARRPAAAPPGATPHQLLSRSSR